MGVDVAGFAWMMGGLFGWMAVAFVGSYVSRQKHREAAEGFLLSLFLGPLGLILAAMLPTREPPRKPWAKGHPMAARR